MRAALKEKLTKVVELVNNVLVNPDLDLDYYIPEDSTDGSYILLKYVVNSTHTQERKIPIKKNYQEKEAEDLANLLTFFIEQFMEQVESVESGAQ